MPTKRDLSDRIHRLFSGKCWTEAPQDPPNFWVEPETGVQPLTVAEFAEEDWLREPHPDVGGKTPSELLEGTTRDREALENTISAMENAISAINDGAFS